MIGPEYIWVGTDSWIIPDLWNTSDARAPTLLKAGTGIP
jgi:hypothetical protein